MTSISDWLRALATEFEAESPALIIAMRRIIVPGFEPLQSDGFLRLDPVEAIYRTGMPPEAAGLARWPTVAGFGGADFEDDFPSHLGAALSLICDRRVEVLDEVSVNLEGTDNFTFTPAGQVIDRRLTSPILVASPVDEFKSLAIGLASLSGTAETAITSAIHLHYGAVLLFDRDLAAAYTLLVAGLETLSRQFGEPPREWSKWEGVTGWDKFIANQSLTIEQSTALKKELMKDRHLRLKQTFVDYVANSIPNGFWSSTWQEYMYRVDMGSQNWTEGEWLETRTMADILPSDKDDLISALRKTYDARSNFVHSGERVVNMYGQLRSQVYGAESGEPLGFAGLRSILRALIYVELNAHVSDYEAPYDRVRFS